ncbi:hypothetical protein BDV93DRAFT_222115 [Ceratobasidium sp. AG-I]|nr:hypothetical protein BDV93DRAFT_222115 [Ceratobasidium sp. AG-I]
MSSTSSLKCDSNAILKLDYKENEDSEDSEVEEEDIHKGEHASVPDTLDLQSNQTFRLASNPHLLPRYRPIGVDLEVQFHKVQHIRACTRTRNTKKRMRSTRRRILNTKKRTQSTRRRVLSTRQS